MGRMTKSHRGKLYIDDAGWGPEAGSVEYGYRVPFGGIHVFIGKIGEPGPEPNICTDLVEMAQRARSAWVKPAMKRAFVGVIHGGSYEDGSESRGDTVVCSDDESSTGETESLYQLQDGRLGAVSMATAFRTPLICPTGWNIHGRNTSSASFFDSCGNDLRFSSGDDCQGRRPCAPAGSGSIRTI